MLKQCLGGNKRYFKTLSLLSPSLSLSPSLFLNLSLSLSLSLPPSSSPKAMGERAEDDEEGPHSAAVGGAGLSNGVCHSTESSVVSPDMCYYCFDVLLAHLTQAPSPRSPHFSNDE